MIKRIIAAAAAATIMVCAVPTVALTSMAYGGNPSDSESGKPTGETDDLEWSVENNVLNTTSFFGSSNGFFSIKFLLF